MEKRPLGHYGHESSIAILGGPQVDSERTLSVNLLSTHSPFRLIFHF